MITECLLGTDNLPSLIEVGEERFQLGEVVRLAFTRSELTVEAWNDLEYWKRDKLLLEEVDKLKRTIINGDSFGIL